MPPHPAASARLRSRRGHIGGRWAVGLGLLLVTGCADRAQEHTVNVFAAASLRSAFTAEATAFEHAHPGHHVALSVGGSQSLVAQVEQGAPADVLATADRSTMTPVTGELVDAPQLLAHNQLALITAKGNPLHLTSLRDLARPGLRVVLAGPLVPAGKAAQRALRNAGVAVRPLSFEDSVSGVVGKVRLGEADAGIAYVTDVGDTVDGTPLADTETDLLIGSLTTTGRDFTAFVLSAAGQQILRAHGFR